MANKPIYQALVGLDFEGIKPSVRVEEGEQVPAKVPQSEVSELLKLGLVRELPQESEASE